MIGTALGWGNLPTIALAIVLALFFGYSLTMVPLLRAGVALAAAIPIWMIGRGHAVAHRYH